MSDSPNTNQCITLIGYRGCGKSSVAEPLASRLGWNCIDADDEIETVAGKSISEIFAEGGEPEFRRIEREVMAELLKRTNIIIAAGGGAILNAETRKEMAQAGPVIYLRADVDTLLRRIEGDDTTATRRPNLTNTGGRAEIVKMLTLREPIYTATATHVINTQTKDIPEIVTEIIAHLPTGMAEGAGGD
ncbi:shikimate kinase [Calycomorphotria hydatis]|uniref:Shikimate kinase n=1 Tax=Calycomorphotria hydatis TaxID=2528027 RepID=A0A517TAC4_9PLAN|nr:shikimate kinase [Calycomorphotria hydatis]QDT65319.1 Shikimate kinase [Calycomorphotria hydatis]